MLSEVSHALLYLLYICSSGYNDGSLSLYYVNMNKMANFSF